RKIWIWILSGLGLILGGCCLFHRDAPCVYGPPKVYGPPPPENPYGFEEVYGPPAPEIDVDPEPDIDTVEEPQQNDLN
ncbi:MAG: hypothetical protein IKZ67_02225, partial [Paludibacteraceae bacterium]|nr:hypothetical protein [Paludibacteraceae bacterium]